MVTEKEGTAHLADVFGYEVSGKTGTAQYYEDKNKNINTFISSFNVKTENIFCWSSLTTLKWLKI